MMIPICLPNGIAVHFFYVLYWDLYLSCSDVIFITPFRGTLVYTDGFVSSIQRVDIIESTVQQVWRFNASAESTHTVTVQATMRLHGVAVGFNVAGHMQGDNEVYHYTAEFVHPMISYAFAVSIGTLCW